MTDDHIWHYRGHPLRQVEWGLWRDLERDGLFFLCYRPQGRNGPVLRRWAYADGENLTVQNLQDSVRQVRAGLNARKLGVAAPVNARRALEDYVTDLQRRNRSARHVKGARRSCERFLDFAEPVALADINVQAIEQWLAQLHEKGRSPRTLNKLRTHLSGWVAWAVGRNYLSDNPAARVSKATEDRELPAFPDPKQLTTIIDKSLPYDAALWTFLVLTGLRRGSFLSLTPKCFQDDGIVVPHTKRRQEWFLDYRDGCPLWGRDLSELGRRIWAERQPTPAYLRFHLEGACKKTKFRFTLHGFRHAFCSYCVMLGETLPDVAAWAHHAQVSTTERYAHLRPRGRARRRENRKVVFTARSHAFAKAMGNEDAESVRAAE